jgi:hypothetical protein
MCSTIVKYTELQSVDGEVTDFCNVPATVFNFASAEYTDVVSGAVDSSVSQATVKVAWDETALRAYVHVIDPAFHHIGGAGYNGDNVQFFISSNPPSSALTSSTTGGTTQITIVPGAGGTPADIDYYGDAPTYSPATSPVFFTEFVSDGYVVEIMWPWRRTPPTASDQIAFNMMIGVDDNGLGRDFEYSYAFKSVVTSNCYPYFSSDDAPWCEMRHWCAPTLSP